eukprot:NODE_86_length_22075_cov_1.190253.p11 type:complete len:280 gc:universal NODE_86_length_22075_cov_1.190253:1603-764(-)
MNNSLCCSCHADRFINPSIRLRMSTCFHIMCEECIERLFVIGRTVSCPQCGTHIKKHLFQEQLFEDISIERDLRIRKRIENIYNKKEEDFENLMEFNDYIELKENLIMNLLEGIDIPATEKIIRKYENEHKEEIIQNQNKEHARLQIMKNKIQTNERKAKERQSKQLHDKNRLKQELSMEKQKLFQDIELGLDAQDAMRRYNEKINETPVNPLETLISTNYTFFESEIKKPTPTFTKFLQFWQDKRAKDKILKSQMDAGGYVSQGMYIRASNELSNIFC